MLDSIKLLVAAGFSRGEITEFDAVSRVDYIARGILQGVACGCDPTIHRSEEFMSRDPFEAMAAMSAEERRELRAYAACDFSEFIEEPDYPPVSQAEVTESANRTLAFYPSHGIYPSTKVPS